MKKATKFTIYLGIYIVALFSIGIAFTFINDALQKSGFFGDIKLSNQSDFGIDSWHEWGARHYWYFWMCILLFILSVIRIFMWCAWFWNKKIFDND